MLLLIIEDEEFFFPSLILQRIFLKAPNKKVKKDTEYQQGEEIKLGVGKVSGKQNCIYQEQSGDFFMQVECHN